MHEKQYENNTGIQWATYILFILSLIITATWKCWCFTYNSSDIVTSQQILLTHCAKATPYVRLSVCHIS